MIDKQVVKCGKYILFLRALLQGWEYLAFSSPSASQLCFLYFQANRASCFCALDREIMAFLEMLPEEHQHFRGLCKTLFTSSGLKNISIDNESGENAETFKTREVMLCPFYASTDRMVDNLFQA